MTKDEVRAWLEDFLRRTGHNHARGCVACITIAMLLEELDAMPRPYCGPAPGLDDVPRVVDGVIVTGPAA